MPLDLHVLSLPLAFILSQDQTLHTYSIVLISWSSSSLAFVKLFFPLLPSSPQFTSLILFLRLYSLFSSPHSLHPNPSYLSALLSLISLPFSPFLGMQNYILFFILPNFFSLPLKKISPNPVFFCSTYSFTYLFFIILPSLAHGCHYSLHHLHPTFSPFLRMQKY